MSKQSSILSYFGSVAAKRTAASATSSNFTVDAKDSGGLSAATSPNENLSPPVPAEKSSMAKRNRVRVISSSSSGNESPVKKAVKCIRNTELSPKVVDNSAADKSSTEVTVKSSEYAPNQKSYNAVSDACWALKGNVPYEALARTFECIQDISGRLEITQILCNFYQSVILLSPSNLISAVYLSLNSLAPAYEGLELGIAEQTLLKVISESSGRTLAHIKAENKDCGDLGLVALNSKSNQRLLMQPKPLSLLGVFAKLKEIAKCQGDKSVNQKVQLIKSLIVAAKPVEAKYIIRSCSGKLRIGLAEKTVLTALGRSLRLAENKRADKTQLEEAEHAVKKAYCECPNFDRIISTALEYGVDNVGSKCSIEAGIPMKPMLAHPTKGISEILTRLDGHAFTCEFKYDGERAQIHIHNNEEKLKIFSRNSEDNTTKYPELHDRIRKAINSDISSAIIDSEVVAIDSEGKIQPFQVLTTRKRKDANIEEIKVEVCIFAFDLLYLNGNALVEKPLRERRRLLHESFTADRHFKFANALDSSTVDDIQEFFEASLRGDCEGLMVKCLDNDATYEIAKRSRSWLKMKKDYLEGGGDTIDAVVIGGYRGTGKRSSTYGCFLLACYNTDTEDYETLCKIGTGFTDENLIEFSRTLTALKIDKQPPNYKCVAKLAPDDWFDCGIVWEVRSADLSISPIHSAARGLVESAEDKGISLRFPRFVRVRDDKNTEDATSSYQIKEMYLSQQQIAGQKTNKSAGANDALDDDYY